MPNGIDSSADNTKAEHSATPHEGQAFTLDVRSNGHRLRMSAPRWSERLALVSIMLIGAIVLVLVYVFSAARVIP